MQLSTTVRSFESKVYLVYKTINLVNQKFYFGYHSTFDLDDGYLGSGLYLWNSIRKYGRSNFLREDLFLFDTPEEAYAKEKELIAENLTSNPLCMNLVPGGRGGTLGYTELSRERISASSKRVTEAKLKAWEALRGKPRSEETKEKLRQANLGKTHTQESLAKMSRAITGRKHSEETKAKIGKAHEGLITSEAAKEKMRLKLAGKPISEEHRAKIIASHATINHSHPHSEETKTKLSELAKNRKPRKVSEETRTKLSKAMTESHRRRKLNQAESKS